MAFRTDIFRKLTLGAPAEGPLYNEVKYNILKNS